jgi:hypothetical protein
MKYIIEYQDQFFKWHRYGESHNVTSASNTAKIRSVQSGKKFRVTQNAQLIEIFYP